MANDGISRRDAGRRLTGLVAAAAGMSVAELRQLLAAELPRRVPAGKQKAGEEAEELAHAREELKALKVLLNPTRKVFEAEYGRTMGYIDPCPKPYDCGRFGLFYLTSPKPCDKQFQPSDCKPGFSCQTQGILTAAAAASGCHGLRCGRNICYRQTCDSLTCTGVNTCPGQECGRLGGRGIQSRRAISPRSLQLLSADPFVRGLTREYGVTDPEELLERIHAALSRRRAKLEKEDELPRKPR